MSSRLDSPLRKVMARALYQEIAAHGSTGTSLDDLFHDLIYHEKAGGRSLYRDWSRKEITRAVDDLARQRRIRLRVRECAVVLRAVESESGE